MTKREFEKRVKEHILNDLCSKAIILTSWKDDIFGYMCIAIGIHRSSVYKYSAHIDNNNVVVEYSGRMDTNN